MANGNRPPVAPVRRVVAAALGTVAAFVMLFGLGRQSWSTVAIGAALLLLALGLLAVAAARGSASAWVIGTGHVHSVSEPPASSVFGRCEMQLVIDAPGLSPRSVKVRDPRVPVAKWPDPGATLPITVALDDPRRVRVLWDEVLTHAEVAEGTVPAAAARGAEPGTTAAASAGGASGLFEREEVFVSRRSQPRTDRPPAPDDPPPDEPVTVDLTDAVRDLRLVPDEIAVHQTPGAPTVIEGVVVDQPPATIPLPRRVTARRHSPPRSPRDKVSADAAAAGVATATDSRMADGAPAPDEPELYDEFASVGVTLLVADLDRSLRFYQRMLGLPVIDRGESNAVFASGSTRLVVRAVREVAPVNRRLVHLNLEVADIAVAYARLRDRGVRFIYGPRVVNRGRKFEVWAAAFRDPDGHGIALTQWRDRAQRATA
ncbi:MAG TPA: VOC family protein [Micromonosporaceae bacterium]|nr:VOC family protein [Micromonosporaceae bacterium]